MTDKLKKVDRQYILSDSSVNEYGFRLLTSGYQLDAYARNPIGYYMHMREDGIVLKWDGLAIEGDNVVGTPIINLSNKRGEQTCSEVENGFLNAASVGHIVVLEWSMEPEMMLAGQTGPTITKWYNKECSLVDIPGNSNALTQLYDQQDNLINLADLKVRDLSNIDLNKINNMEPIVLTADSLKHLSLNAQPDANGLNAAIANLAAKAAKADTLQTEINDLKAANGKAEVKNILDKAIEDKKVTVELSAKLAADYANNPEGLKALVLAMPAYRSIAEKLSSKVDESEATWSWEDYEKNDPSGKKLKALRAENADRYKEIFDKKFNAPKD